MSSIFEIKTVIMTPLIKMIIHHPKLMESKAFLKAMIIFPDKISNSFDFKVKSSDFDYQAALSKGLTLIENSPQRILDLCTGTGFAAFMASERFPNASITGVDQSEGMIEVARGKVEHMDAFRIKFERGNAARLAYDDKSYDLVMTSNAPIYLPEASRILKPGGMILIAFSFGGNAFANAEKEIDKLMEKNGLTLLNLESICKGAFIIGQKNTEKNCKPILSAPYL